MHTFVLTPERYVDVVAAEDDSEAFAKKMKRLTGTLAEQFAEGAKLEANIWKAWNHYKPTKNRLAIYSCATLH